MHRKGGQAAIDFMVAYGFAILVISIVIYVVLQLAIYQPGLTPESCTGAPGFTCTSYTLSTNGMLSIQLAQAQGGTLNITGAACSSAVNSSGNRPAYGNIGILGYSVVPQFYPSNAMANGMVVYSDVNFIVEVYCYNPTGLTGPSYGSTFNGYLWLNYTNTALPASMRSKPIVAQFTIRYT